MAAEIANNAHLDYTSEKGREWLLNLVRDHLSSASEEAVFLLKRGLPFCGEENWKVLPPPSDWDYITDSSSPAPVLFAPHSPLQGLLQSYQDLCCRGLNCPGWVKTIISNYHSLVIPSANPDEAVSGMSFVIMQDLESYPYSMCARILTLATDPYQKRKGHASRLVTALEKVAVFMATQISAPAVLHVQSFSTFFSKFGMEPEDDDFGIFTGSVCTEVRGG